MDDTLFATLAKADPGGRPVRHQDHLGFLHSNGRLECVDKAGNPHHDASGRFSSADAMSATVASASHPEDAGGHTNAQHGHRSIAYSPGGASTYSMTRYHDNAEMAHRRSVEALEPGAKRSMHREASYRHRDAADALDRVADESKTMSRSDLKQLTRTAAAHRKLSAWHGQRAISPTDTSGRNTTTPAENERRTAENEASAREQEHQLSHIPATGETKSAREWIEQIHGPEAARALDRERQVKPASEWIKEIHGKDAADKLTRETPAPRTLSDERHTEPNVPRGKWSEPKHFDKTEFSQEQRDKLADEGKAEPDGSYPIRNRSDLSHAISRVGTGDNYAKDKAWIMRRARELGATDALPEDWVHKAGNPNHDASGHFASHDHAKSAGAHWDVQRLRLPDEDWSAAGQVHSSFPFSAEGSADADRLAGQLNAKDTRKGFAAWGVIHHQPDQHGNFAKRDDVSKAVDATRPGQAMPASGGLAENEPVLDVTDQSPYANWMDRGGRTGPILPFQRSTPVTRTRLTKAGRGGGNPNHDASGHFSSANNTGGGVRHQVGAFVATGKGKNRMTGTVVRSTQHGVRVRYSDGSESDQAEPHEYFEPATPSTDREKANHQNALRGYKADAKYWRQRRGMGSLYD